MPLTGISALEEGFQSPDYPTDQSGIDPKIARGSAKQFESGAIRSADAENTQFSLFCPTAEQRLAATYAEGLVKYGPDNWTKGMPIIDVMNHVKRHINRFLAGDEEEDHLAHAAWGLFAVIHFQDNCRCHQVRQVFNFMDNTYREVQYGPKQD